MSTGMTQTNRFVQLFAGFNESELRLNAMYVDVNY